MILVDANLLVYAHVRDFAEHDPARSWLDSQFDRGTRVGLPWPSLLGFLRLVTNPRMFAKPESLTAAWRQVGEWLDREGAWIPAPGPRHRDILRSVLAEAGTGANLIPDAHLAALATEHGLALASTDGDFARFSGLRWINPLRAA